MSAWVGLVVAIVGWIATVFIFLYLRGKDRGRLESKIESLQSTINEEKGKYETVKAELSGTTQRFQNIMEGKDGNPKLLSEDFHRNWCGQAQRICAERFLFITQSLERHEHILEKRDDEIFSRLRKLEGLPSQIDSLKTSLKEFAEASSARIERNEESIENISGRLTSHIEKMGGVVGGNRRAYD